MKCFPTWLVWTLGSVLTLTGTQMLFLAYIGLRAELFRFRFARRRTYTGLGKENTWGCGMPGCGHARWLYAFFHAAWRRPWRLRGL